MKKLAIFAAAFVLTLGLAQCKKEPTNAQLQQGETVHISVRVDNNASTGSANGSRANVDPSNGKISFNDGDVLYVGYNGEKVDGELTYSTSTSSFSGDLDIYQDGDDKPLYFYYMGGVTPTYVNYDYCTVDISDQTSNYPVISCGTSTVAYTGAGAYETTLLNQCALVKFNVTTASTEATCLRGFYNKVTVNFFGNTVTPSKAGDGVIKLGAGSGEKWAILLPQEALAAGATGAAYSEDGCYMGTYGAVPAISANACLSTGIAVEIADPYVDLGLPSGTLWATCNVGADKPEDYGDYFAWGETQTKDSYDESNYQYGIYDDGEMLCYMTKYCDDSGYGYNGYTDDLTTLEPSDDAATANWGTDWRMPTEAEWQELLDNTTQRTTTQNGVRGTSFTASNGNTLFLPAAGYRNGSNLSGAGNYGYYWSSSLVQMESNCASRLYTSSLGDGDRYFGLSVRAVRAN